MIIRARPKYLNNIDFANLNYDDMEVKDDEFYFNSGRAALKFYLTYLSNEKKKKINIAMQAFNCSVVLDAALESDCNVVLLDIKLDDFSISYQTIEKLFETKETDVLLLTHYQGIPNNEYKDIIDVCKKHNVIVIEDLAQTIDSKINDFEVGTLGDVSIYSYAFDKPFSCFSGGKLKFNSLVDKEFIKMYELLDIESEKDANLDIETLKFLYEYSSEKYFEKGIDNVNLIRFFKKIRNPKKITYILIKSKIINISHKILFKVIRIFFSIRNNQIFIKKLNKKKILLIKKQEQNYIYDESNVLYLLRLCEQYNLKSITDNTIKWNRFSIIDEKGYMTKYLLDKGVQVGNFNWSLTLDKVYKNMSSINIFEPLTNADYASKYILNIPIWSSKIKEVCDDK